MFAERIFPHAAGRVWSVFAAGEGAHAWAFRVPGYRGVPGNQFDLMYLPILGTRFTGRFRCELTRFQPSHTWECRTVATVKYGATADWVNRVELTDHPRGTLVRWALSGTNLTDGHERVLYRVYTGHVRKTLGDLGRYLDQNPHSERLYQPQL